MAYNVLKGMVEGSVDQHADQEIDGIKIFKNTISASMFYDTDAKSPCATENNVGIKKLSSEAKFGILTYQGEKIAKSNYNLTFDGLVLITDKAIIKSLSGSGEGLKNVPAEFLSGKLQAKTINYGPGLDDRRGVLKVKTSSGIVCGEDGLSVEIHPNSALDFKNKRLVIDPSNTLNVQEGGQNISDADFLLLYDSSRGEVRHSSFKNFYDGFVNLKIPRADGNRNCVQFKGIKTFEASQDFTFEPSAKTLTVKGLTRTDNLRVSQNIESNNKILMNGSVYKGIKVVTDAHYDFDDTDNTVLFSPTKHKIVATLPPAKENAGRVIVVKQICAEDDRYKIARMHGVTIKTGGELIDFSQEVTLKSNYSIRTFHCDGSNWWIINRSGS